MDLAEISVSSVPPGVAGQCLTAGSKSPAPAEPAAEPEPPRSCRIPGHRWCNVELQNTVPGTMREGFQSKEGRDGRLLRHSYFMAGKSRLFGLGLANRPLGCSFPNPPEHVQDSRSS